jgi:hypothetical protein
MFGRPRLTPALLGSVSSPEFGDLLLQSLLIRANRIRTAMIRKQDTLSCAGLGRGCSTAVRALIK